MKKCNNLLETPIYKRIIENGDAVEEIVKSIARINPEENSQKMGM